MVKSFQNYISANELFDKNDAIVLAVSGGIDSVVLLELMVNLKYRVGVAHCNFHLRGQESDGDEAFVRSLAEKYDLPFFVQDFDTKGFADEKGISIQMAARELRFDWFEEIRQNHGYYWIALGHHRDDVIETFFINLSRGTGIKGLAGIKPKSGKLVRPLLFASRKEIFDYCTANSLSYREDSSNAKTTYLRNKLRHRILPVFQELNPRFSQNMVENIERLSQVEQIYRNSIVDAKQDCAYQNDKEVYISISKLKKYMPVTTYLFEFIHPYGFSSSDIDEIINALDGSSGKLFYSATHRLLKDREHLIISQIEEPTLGLYYIDEGTELITEPLRLSFKVIRKAALKKIEKAAHFAYLDYDKLNFPLILRHWRKGEYFMPFGMTGLKKISDFFIDRKMSIVEKEQSWILASDEHPVWIVGQRSDNRYRVREDTQRILVVEMMEA